MKRALLVVLIALAAPAVASARPEPVTWCGNDEVTQNRLPDLEVSAAEQVRVFYAVPSDGADNFLATASGIATDAAWIDEWWRLQDPTRTPRFDRYPFPGCTSTFGGLDIGFVRLPNPASYYATSNTPSIRLDNDLARTVAGTQKTIVYYDGPIRSKTVCGETDYLANDAGGANGIVYVYPQSGCHLTPVGAGSSAEVAGHELLHNLGAVPSGAPNECPTSSGHVCDGDADILYPYITSGSTLDAVILDLHRDDYYGHGASQWDVRNSAWLEHLPQWPFSVAVEGSGMVSARVRTLTLPCDSGCAGLPLDDGTKVSAIAVPKPGWVFATWGGSCSGRAPACTFVVSGQAAATAQFARARTTASVRISGNGRVTSAPAGVSCPGTCRTSFSAASVRLVAKAAAGWRLAGWSGACSGTRTCSVGGNAAVRARFVRR